MVACDGIWDCLSNEQCVKKLIDLQASLKPKDDNMCPPVESMLEEICPEEIGDGEGTDNMTAILVKFK